MNDKAVDFKQVNSRIGSDALSYLNDWIGKGNTGDGAHGKYFYCKNPVRDEKNESLTVWLSEGNWKDHASGDSGGDFVSLYAYLKQMSQLEAGQTLSASLGLNVEQPAQRTKPKRAAKPPRPEAHRQLGTPSAVWAYQNAKGIDVFWVYRFEQEDGKAFRPLHFQTDSNQWKWSDPKGLLPLYHLAQFKNSDTLVFCEGEKAADAAAVFFPECVTTTTAHGAQSPKKSDFSPCKDKQVIIWPDNDEAGRNYAKTVAEKALDAGARVAFILQIPNDKPAKWDAADASDTERPAQWERVRFNQDEPAIVVTGTRLSTEQTTPALQALANNNLPPRIFNQEGRLMRLSLVTGKRSSKQVQLIALDALCLKHELERSARFFRLDRYGNERHAAPPDNVAQDILAMPDYPQFPTLERITTAPCIVKNGEYRVIDAPGYDTHTGLYYFQNEPLKIPDSEPTAANLRDANGLIDDLLVDFPFADEASKAHAIALLLLPFCRDLVRGNTPLHFVTAPSQRTGKSLLVEVITGVFNPMISATTAPEGRDADEEWRKKITSALLTESPHIFFDNVKGVIDSANLEAALTSESITARLLGTNREATMPNNKVWVATGNNAELSIDMTGRTVEIRLDANMENPSERRAFKHPNIRRFAQLKRAKLIQAVLVLIRHWITQGCPEPDDGTPYLGGFESWRQVIGGILTAAGIGGFLHNRRQTAARVNTQSDVFQVFIQLWFAAHKSLPVRAKELHAAAAEAGVFEEVLTAKDEAAEQKRLGRWLSKNTDRVIGGFKLVKTKDSSTGKNAYQLQELTPNTNYNTFKPVDAERGGKGSNGGKSDVPLPNLPPITTLSPCSDGEGSEVSGAKQTSVKPYVGSPSTALVMDEEYY